MRQRRRSSKHDVLQVNPVADTVQGGRRRLVRGFLVDDRLDLAAPPVAPVVWPGRVLVDRDVQILGGPGLKTHDLAQPVVVLADDLDHRAPVVVGNLLAVPRLGQLHPGDQLVLLVPQPDQRLGNPAGLVGVAAVEELLLDLAELGGGQHQDTARS